MLRCGCCWTGVKGRLFYFPACHESYPVYYQRQVRQVLKNAARWACQEAPIRDFPPWAREAEPMEGFKK